jgi:hypothetical protein
VPAFRNACAKIADDIMGRTIAPKDQSNRRKRLPQYAVWKIHPVMKLDAQ